MQYLGSLMALLTLTVILFTQVIVISAGGVASSNGTYEYENTQFVCNSNDTFTIVTIIESPGGNKTSDGACRRVGWRARDGTDPHMCLCLCLEMLMPLSLSVCLYR
jgi:hypothetical protein